MGRDTTITAEHAKHAEKILLYRILRAQRALR